MAQPIYVTVGSGGATSGAFTIERPDFPLVIEVPSLSAATEVRLQFSATSGGPFFGLSRDDGSGLPYAVTSGSGPAYGIVRCIPSPWGRISLVGSQSDTRTFMLYSTRKN